MSNTYKEAGPRRRPHFSLQGSLIKREALHAIYHCLCESRLKPDAQVQPQGKPDAARGPSHRTRCARKPAYAGGLRVHGREARPSGRPCADIGVIDMEAGPGRRPFLYPRETLRCGRPTIWIYIQVEAGLCRRPNAASRGSPI